MNINTVSIILKDDYAYISNDPFPYEKEEIMNALKDSRNVVSKTSVKKKETDNAFLYKVTFDKEINNIIIPKKYIEQNKQYIQTLDKWHSINRKKYLRNLKALAITATISGCGIAIFHEPLKEVFDNIVEYFDDLFTDEVGDLEREILIHSGHYNNPDGSSISAQYNHGCAFVDDKSISVSDRIKLYCEENELEYLEENALQKYEYLYNDNTKLGKEINLKQIEKEHKQKVKNLR